MCQRLGVAAHVLKPCKPSDLLKVLLRVLGKAVAEETLTTGRPRPIAPPTANRLHILLAEDSLMNQKLAVGLLTKWGHTVHVVANGLAAVEAWEQGGFDLILMDVQMPDMNGREATAEIRRREAQSGRHIPIIALTAHALHSDRDNCLAAGMDGYVSKPIRQIDLLRAIETCSPRAAAEDIPPPSR